MVIRINKGKSRAVRYVGVPQLDSVTSYTGALWFRFTSDRAKSISAGEVTVHLQIDELRRLLALAEGLQS